MRNPSLSRLYSYALAVVLLFGLCVSGQVAAQAYEDVVKGRVQHQVIMGGSYKLGAPSSSASAACGQAVSHAIGSANAAARASTEYSGAHVESVQPACGTFINGGNGSVMVSYALIRKEDGFVESGWVAEYRIQAQCTSGGDPDAYGNCVERVYKDNSCKAGNPVSPGSGEKFHNETDYQGAGAHPLEFSRLYRSNFRGIPRIANGWTHNWQRSIDVVAAASVNGSTAKAQKADGTHISFKYNGTAWLAFTNGTFDVLTEIKTNGIRTGWQLKIWSDDSVEHYSAEGALLKIVQRNGWTSTVTYSTTSTAKEIAPYAGLPITITNHFGRKLQLRYDYNSQLVTLIDPAGGQIKYGYDSSLNLTKVTWQDNTVKQYLYATPANGRLTGVIDEMGIRIGTYAYDNQGRVTSSEKANGAEKLTFLYNVDKSTSITDYTPAPTGVGAPIATTRTHRFGYAQGVVRPTSVTAPCPVCGNTASSYIYDANGNITQRTEHDGTVTKFTYDAKNRETSRIEAFGTTAAKTYTTQWHGTWNLPTLGTEPLKITAYTYDAKGNLTGQAETPTTDVNGSKAAAGIRDVGKPIDTQGYAYDTNNLPITDNKKTQIKNAQNIWITSVVNSYAVTYDAYGNQSSNKDMVNNVTATVTVYDKHGNFQTGIGYANESINYNYNPRGKILNGSINNFSSNFNYYLDGRNRKIIYSNGDVIDYLYDGAKNIAKITKNGIEFYPNNLTTSASTKSNQTALTNPYVGFKSNAQQNAAPQIAMAVPAVVPIVVAAWPRIVGIIGGRLISGALKNCPDCAKIKQNCRDQCSDSELPTPPRNDGWNWVKCYNRCIAGTGC